MDASGPGIPDIAVIAIMILIAVLRFCNNLLRAAYFALGRISLLVFVERAKKDNPHFWSVLEDRIQLNYSAQVFDKITLLVLLALGTLLVPYVHWQHFLVVLGYIALFDLVLPNLTAIFMPEWLISRLFPMLRFPYLLFQPVTALMVSVARRYKTEDEEDLEEDDIQAFLKAGAEEGIIEQGDETWLSNLLGFGETVVREVMTPRTDIVCVDEAMTFEEILQVFKSTKFSRLPVYRDDIDHIIGVLIFKDFYQLKESQEPSELGPVIKPVNFVPENKRISELLQDMLRERMQMVIVIDEFGGTAGLSTLEDLIEEIVGEIHDEHEEPGSDEIIPLENGSFLVDGKVLLEDFSRMFGIAVAEDGIDTVGGFIFNREGKIPTEGSKIHIEALEVEIMRADDRRIYQVKVTPTTVPANS